MKIYALTSSIKAPKDYFRTIYSLDKFNKLVKSVNKHGVQTPIEVDSNFNLIDGYLRLKAAKEAGLLEVPIVINDYPKKKLLLHQLEVNLKSLASLDIAKAVVKLLDDYTIKELAKELKITPLKLSSYLSLLEEKTKLSPTYKVICPHKKTGPWVLDPEDRTYTSYICVKCNAKKYAKKYDKKETKR